MKIPCLHVWVCIAVVLLSALGYAAEPASAPSMANTDPPRDPHYPVAYGAPSAQQIKQTLDRVRERLESATGSSIVTRGSKEPVSDLSKPGDYVLDSGPERKFSPYSYPMGVVYSGMLLANEVTGDKKYADFVAKRFQLFADNLPKLAAWPHDRSNPF